MIDGKLRSLPKTVAQHRIGQSRLLGVLGGGRRRFPAVFKHPRQPHGEGIALSYCRQCGLAFFLGNHDSIECWRCLGPEFVVSPANPWRMVKKENITLVYGGLVLGR